MKIILEDYSELFDVYLTKGELPEYAQGDVLAKYIKDVLDDPGNHHLCTTDPVWKDLLKSSLMDFFRQLLPHMMELEKEEAKEKKYMSNFQRADIKGKRLMWPLIEEDIQRLYPPSEVNLEGYVQLMKENKIPKDLIFVLKNFRRLNLLNRCSKYEKFLVQCLRKECCFFLFRWKLYELKNLLRKLILFG